MRNATVLALAIALLVVVACSSDKATAPQTVTPEPTPLSPFCSNIKNGENYPLNPPLSRFPVRGTKVPLVLCKLAVTCPSPPL